MNLGVGVGGRARFKLSPFGLSYISGVWISGSRRSGSLKSVNCLLRINTDASGSCTLKSPNSVSASQLPSHPSLTFCSLSLLLQLLGLSTAHCSGEHRQAVWDARELQWEWLGCCVRNAGHLARAPGTPRPLGSWSPQEAWAPSVVTNLSQQTVAMCHHALSSTCHAVSDHSQHTGYPHSGKLPGTLFQLRNLEKDLGAGGWLAGSGY